MLACIAQHSIAHACTPCPDYQANILPLSNTCFVINSTNTWYKYQMQVNSDSVTYAYVNGKETPFSYSNNILQVSLQDTTSYPAIVCLYIPLYIRYTDICPQNTCIYTLINNFPNDCCNYGAVGVCTSSGPSPPPDYITIPPPPLDFIPPNIPNSLHPSHPNHPNIPDYITTPPPPLDFFPPNIPSIPNIPDYIIIPPPPPDISSSPPSQPNHPNHPNIPDYITTPPPPLDFFPPNIPSIPSIPDYIIIPPPPPDISSSPPNHPSNHFPWCRCDNKPSQLSLSFAYTNNTSNEYCFTVTIADQCIDPKSPCCGFQLAKIEFESQISCYGSIVYSKVNGIKKAPFFQSKPGPSVKVTQINIPFNTLLINTTEICIALRPPCSTLAQLCSSPSCTYAMFEDIANNSCCVVGPLISYAD